MQSIYLVRHAKTQANSQGRLCGLTQSSILDEPEEIKNTILPKLGELKNAVVISSPSLRALDTAKTFYNDIVIEDDFVEFNFGNFENMTFKEIENLYPEEYQKLCMEGLRYSYPNGENISSFIQRISIALEKAISSYPKKEKIVIMSHSGVIQGLLSYLLCGDEKLYWNFKIENCMVAKFYFCEGMPVIEYIR